MDRCRMMYRSLKLVHQCNLCTCLRDPKKFQKTKKPHSGKLGVCPDHPHRRFEIQFGTVGGLQAVVLSFMFIKIC